MWSLSFLFVLIFIGNAVAQNKESGHCPDAAIQPEFNASDFAGLWFEYARTPCSEESNGKCISFEYLTPVDGRITINRRKISVFTNQEDLQTSQITILARGQAISTDFYDYRVVKTDYRNYAVIYACKNQSLSTFHLDMLWILTREPIPSKNFIEMALMAIDENGLPSGNLMKTEQKDCPAPP